MASILLVDDDANFRKAAEELLALLEHDVVTAETVAAGKQLLEEQRFDVLMLDFMLPDGSGLQLLDNLTSPPQHVAVITGHPAIKSLVKSLYGPNISYLLKPINLDQFKALLGRVDGRDAAQESSSRRHFGCLVGESPAMRRLYGMIERIAASDATVLLQGESGVGKEVVAKAIHIASQSQGQMVAANCGAFSRELLGSELFGHEKGAFTGALRRKPGLFEQAENGTLFLDEITEMPIDMQPALLRVLETNRVTRVGGTEEIPLNCRIISATNRNVQELADEKCLREDLYFRLAMFPIVVPPLRERREDIPLLAETFLHELNASYGQALTISEREVRRLQDYDWPGNVRELRHAIHRAFIMTEPGTVDLQLPERLGSPFSIGERESGAVSAAPEIRVGKTIEELERELIYKTLDELGGEKTAAARMLGISVKTLYNRLKAYNSEAEA